MIEPKLKQCKGCSKDKYIFAKGLCDWCYRSAKQKEYARKPKPNTKVKRKRIKTISDKRAELLSEYRKVRDKYMSEHAVCEAKLRNCQNKSSDLHHVKGKTTRTDYLDPDNFMALCRSCHNNIHEHPKEAYEKGFLIKINR